ncbi:Membrane protein involved in the export of O-antigen and teichoic acid [Sinomicrobium oceani]|uniref:Membrane protein involved in the export of O-antigen and teichoic acid n=2 Tax=Sinomicrobium oceani TaxID=1150368 RepID=A0A1K1QZG4_9FLAO|nr:Membrane protein involved in the export of O-antigen and teichoic acid [Sinomicrobium oceani]
MIGNFSSRIISFVLVFFMTYFLTKKEMGEYDLILTTISLIVPCVSLQFDSSLLRWLLDKNEKNRKKEIFKNVFFVIGVNIIIYSIFYFIISYYVNFNYKLHIYILSLFMILYPLVQQGTRGEGRNKLYAFSSVFYSFLFVGFTISFLYLFNLKVEGILMGNILAISIIIIFLFIKNNWIDYIGLKGYDKYLIKDMIKYSLPLLPNTLSWWLIGSATRYVILLYLGVDDNGVFAISYKYPTIILMLSNVFTLAWQEKAIITSENSGSMDVFSSVLKKYIKLLLGALIVLTCMSKFLMGFVDANFFEAWKYIPILLYAVFLKAISAFYGVGYLTTKKTRGVFYSSLIGGIITIALSFILTPLIGLYGVSISILAGYFILLVLRINDMKKLIKINFPYDWFVILTIIYILFSLTNLLHNTFFFMITVFCSLILFAYLNYNQLSIIVKKIFKK